MAAYGAAASGYRIGHVYDELWHAVMSAPVPKNLKADGEAVYHEELSKLIKLLIRHAIRYWEMTLMFIERTGMKTTWADKTKDDLTRLRALLLEQPPGEGGLPPTAAKPEPKPSQPTAAPTPAAEPSATSAPVTSQPDAASANADPNVSQDTPPREPSSRSRGAVEQVH